MRRGTLLILCLPLVAAGAEYLELVESKVYEVAGSQADITKRAATCVQQVVRNDGFSTQDSSTGLLSASLVKSQRETIAGGQVLLSADPDAGLVVANNRVTYSGGMLIGTTNTRSTLTVLVKEGRFKVQHTNIETATKDSGIAENRGYVKQGKWKMSGWERAQKALDGVSDKLAQCVVTAATSKDW